MFKDTMKAVLIFSSLGSLFISGCYFYVLFIREPVHTKEDLYQCSGKLKSYSFVARGTGISVKYRYDLKLENIKATFNIPYDFVDFFKKSEFERDLKIGDSIEINISNYQMKNLSDFTAKIRVFSVVSSNKVYLDYAQCIDEYKSIFYPLNGTIFAVFCIISLIIYWIYFKRLRESSKDSMQRFSYSPSIWQSAIQLAEIKTTSPYTLTDEGRQYLEKRTRETYPMIAFLFLPAIYSIIFMSTRAALLISIPFIIFGITFFIGVRVNLKMLSSIRLTLDNNQILVQMSGRKDKIIRSEDVFRVTFDKDEGCHLFCGLPIGIVFIPIGLQNYEQVVNKIRSWHKPENYPPYTNAIIIILSITVIILAVSVYLLFRLRD
jgi:hypothetical protein